MMNSFSDRIAIRMALCSNHHSPLKTASQAKWFNDTWHSSFFQSNHHSWIVVLPVQWVRDPTLISMVRLILMSLCSRYHWWSCLVSASHLTCLLMISSSDCWLCFSPLSQQSLFFSLLIPAINRSREKNGRSSPSLFSNILLCLKKENTWNDFYIITSHTQSLTHEPHDGEMATRTSSRKMSRQS